MSILLASLFRRAHLMAPADDAVSTGGAALDAAGEQDDGAPAVGDDAAADETGQGGEVAAGTDDADGELQVTIGDDPVESDDIDPDGKPAPGWLKELRKANRESKRELRALREENQRLKQTAAPAAPVMLGPEPTLESCNYDTDRLAAELKAWYAKKVEVDAQETETRKKAEAEAQQWQGKLAAYGQASKALKVQDFADAEEVVKDALNVTQQGIIVHGADNPALVVYALGKNPKKAAELAAIADPVKFAFQVAKLESQLKVQPKRTAPPPEGRVRSTVPGAAAIDNQLEKLREEAAKTGDMTKVLAYKRQQRQAA